MWEDSDGDEKDTRRRRREHRRQQRCHRPAESASSGESEGGRKRSRGTSRGGGGGESDSSCSEAGNARRVAQKVSMESTSSLRAEPSRGEPSNTVAGLEAVQSTERGERQGQDHGRSEAVALGAGNIGAKSEPPTGAGRPAIDVPESVRAKVRAMLAGRLTPEQGPDAAVKVGHLKWERKVLHEERARLDCFVLLKGRVGAARTKSSKAALALVASMGMDHAGGHCCCTGNDVGDPVGVVKAPSIVCSAMCRQP
eukprot:SM000237S08135  [mRNA]  locus=s237:16865:22304:+ [translate_table: standard]